MAAIMDYLDNEKVQELLSRVREYGVCEGANYNAQIKYLIGGEKEAVEKAKELCLELGAKGAIELKVAGPFHTSLLEEA